ncbi:GyrI-like domain-containing protein [Anaerocolumna sp. AGMB13020]|uniref:GyrI-like domain-containing protein n=1 Tax=Anaerocolumna sp. AGMB13020 TaxID=3081750 RepID=UPI0029535329|nr:GyrI-like domain-containing protein [Anaerocolumna sp. AGMB13020]WOO35679.1 GyrI-like domain-containing protein [Anaerocolumna sp. AGMB13020]
MIKVRIEQKPAFQVIGKKIWISGQENEIFGEFWKNSRENGLVNRLKELYHQKHNPILNSAVVGISCVEKEPSLRSFYFYIAAEADAPAKILSHNPDLELYTVAASDWAVFENRGSLPEALIAAEMYAFMEWLPASEFIHANAPEMELYPPAPDSNTHNDYVEFWLPIRKK